MPDPLHIPPMVTVFPPSAISTATSFFLVSVVIIAFAALVPASFVLDKTGAIVSMPAVILSMGSCIPMTPVEATKTLSSGI